MAAAQQTIDTLTIRGQSQGLDKLEADLNKVSAAQDKLAQSSAESAKVTESSARRQISAAGAFERLTAQIDPAFRAQQQMARGQGILDRALQQGVINSDQYAARLKQLHDRYGSLGAANNNLVGQTGNLAAQFNDIGVQLAAGTSPFLVAVQQGTQISQVLGDTPGGARGAVKALGAAFLSVISPISLATIAAIALGGAMIQYLTSTDDKLQSLDDKLKAHSDLIKAVKDAYGEAAKGVDEYAARSGAVLEQQLRASMDRLREELDKQSKAIARSAMEVPRIQAFNPTAGIIESDPDSIDRVLPKYEAFESAVSRLREQIKAGNPDIRAFQEAIAAAMGAAGDDKELRKLGDQLIERAKEAQEVEEALAKATRAVRLMSSAAGDGIGDLKEYGEALKALANIGLPKLSDQQRALQEYRRAMQAAGGSEDRASARAAYDAAVWRANERDAEKAAEEAAKKAEQTTREAARKAETEARQRENTWKRAVDSINDQTRALEQQAATYGMGAGEVARYRVEQELLNAAWEAGKTDTPELREQIGAMAEQAAQAAERIEQLREAAEWSDFTGGALKGFISDLRSGKDSGEAFLNVLEKIADKLLDMSIDWMLGRGTNPFTSFMGAISGVGDGPSVTAVPGASGGGVAAFSGLGKLPEVITSAVSPLKEAANSVADVARYATGGLRAQVESYVRDGALSRGMDPDIIAKGINQESGFNPFALGDSGKSYGVMQLYTGGGLGNEALKRGISLDPSNWKEQVDFGLDYMKKNGHGQWYGFRDSGIRDPWAGIDRNGPQAFNGSAGNDILVGGMGQDMQLLSGNLDQLSTSMSSATPQITQGLTGLTNITQQGGQSIGGALNDTASTIAEGSNGVGSAMQQLMQALSKGGSGGGLGGLLGLFSKGGGDWSDTSSWTIGDAMNGVTFSANGNIMTSSGPLPLHTYSKGGIASRPQLSIFGEGRTPEAYVPLPDGRTIPVTMSGGGSSGGITINNNVVNKSEAQVETTARQNSDGTIDIMTFIDERAKGAVRKDARRNGPLSRELGVGFNGRG